MRIETYQDELRAAETWRRSNTRHDQERAEKRLREAMVRFPHALPIGDELVLVLKQLKKLDEAVKVLRELDRRFRLVGEETLCRWGAVYKLKASQALRQPGGAAWNDLVRAEHYYSRAYAEHRTFYPLINELSVRFTRAGLAAALGRTDEARALRNNVQAAARAMLTDTDVWEERKPDDGIWSLASRGEACLLCEEWNAADQAYAEAVRRVDGQQFYLDCMREQVHQVLVPTFRQLAIEPAARCTLVADRSFFNSREATTER